MATHRSGTSHPVYELLHSKTALQNSPEVIDLVGSRSAAQLLMQLAFHQKAHEQRSPWFFRKQSDLAAELGMSVETVRRALRHLEALGLVHTKRKRLERRKSRSANFYCVDFQRLQELLDALHAKYALHIEAPALASREDVEAVFGPQGDQSVKMSGSILEIHRNAKRAHTPHRRWHGPDGLRSSERPHRRHTGPERWLANNPVDPSMGQLRGLEKYGYDANYIPADPRLPEPGEPEALVRERFDTIPAYMVTWLQTEALTRPLQDIRTAVTMAQKGLPENVIAIADTIKQMRGYQRFLAEHPGYAQPIRWGN